ncbi:MAG: carotenoid biosynthesis protein [Myxococcales bacterium]|nr:carotenoid biosynthesis protein [Myxococcales bacterium]
MTPMPWIEASAFAIVAIFIVVRARRASVPGAFLARLAWLAVASFVAEDTCIHLYGFYAYHPNWSVFVDRVPLAILLIWPVVIHSAWDLARRLLGPTHAFVPLAGAAIVLADAWLIEPVSVTAGLWSWTEPGLFNVPPVGVFGWSFHAGLCMLVLARTEPPREQTGMLVLARTEPPREQTRAAIRHDALLLLTPLGTHALLLASWWGLFRWLPAPLPLWPLVVMAWCTSLALVTWSVHSRARARVPIADMLVRTPAAGFFFTLLALVAKDPNAGSVIAPLSAWVLAFAPPYLSLMNLCSSSQHVEAATPQP